jgi:hypothetical protein
MAPGRRLKRWKDTLVPGDTVVGVGEATCEFYFPNGDPVLGSGLVIVGEKSIALVLKSMAWSVDALKHDPMRVRKMITIPRDDIIISVSDTERRLTIRTRKGETQFLWIDPLCKQVRDALIAGLKDTTDRADEEEREKSQGSANETVVVPKAELEQALDELRGQLRQDETVVANAPVAHLQQLAMLVVTDRRLIWKFTEPGGPVLSLAFHDISQVQVDEGLGVLFTYRPADFPDGLRSMNPNAELDAELIFQHGGEEVHQLVLDRAYDVVRLRPTGVPVATGVGYLEGAFSDEHYPAKVEAHKSALVVLVDKMPLRTFPYSALAWFRVDSLPEGRWASDLPGAGQPVIRLSLSEMGVKDRWLLVVKPDYIDRWRVILAHFGIRDAGLGDSAHDV